MPGIASTWPLHFLTEVGGDDLDDDGWLTQSAVLRIADEVVDAYVAACPRLRELTLDPKPRSAVMRTPIGTAGPTAVTGAVTEIFPTCFDVDFRIHPPVGGEPAVEATWAVAVAEGVTTDLRDELIALAHAARHAG